MLAEAYGLAGEFSRGLGVIEEAISIANETSLRYWIAELLRRKGELLSSLGRGEEALRCYDEAIAAAEAQNANALLLRAALSRATAISDAGSVGRRAFRSSKLLSRGFQRRRRHGIKPWRLTF